MIPTKMIALKKVKMEFNHREVGDVSDLMGSMRGEGQITAVMLMQRKKDYLVIGGHRRVLAAIKLGWEDIRGDIYEGLDAQEILLKQLIENTARKDCTVFEQSLVFNHLLFAGMTDKEIAVRVTLPVNTVRAVQKLTKALSEDKLREISYSIHSNPKRIEGMVPLTTANNLCIALDKEEISKKEFSELWRRSKAGSMVNLDVSKFLKDRAYDKYRDKLATRFGKENTPEPENVGKKTPIPPPTNRDTTWILMRIQISNESISKFLTRKDLRSAIKKAIHNHVVELPRQQDFSPEGYL